MAMLPVQDLSALWGVPFAGMLLSIALLPLWVPHWWHQHFGKVAAAWALAFLVPCAVLFGASTAGDLLGHTLVEEYLPFMVLLLALYTTAGGIHVRGNLHGSPRMNVLLMAIGAALASVMGTTGACMLMIRPLLRANDNRRRNAHVVVFFIFVVGNAGGALTPLGDPPLFLGFLQGVDFFWTAQALWAPTAFLIGALLALFAVMDAWIYRRDGVLPRDPSPDGAPPFGLEGRVNALLLVGVLVLLMVAGTWKSGWSFMVLGHAFTGEQLLRDLGLLLVVGASMALTPAAVRARNQFSWGPMAEVAKLFAGIFLTMAPVLLMLKAGAQGPFAAVAQAVTDSQGQPLPWAYFWLAGGLSSFLDNAPTYLVFFNLAGGDALQLMGPMAATLTAISAGSVYMGANTYIGNAPNFMVKAIAEERGVRMPSFFGYMAWSSVTLLPLFGLMTWIWF